MIRRNAALALAALALACFPKNVPPPAPPPVHQETPEVPRPAAAAPAPEAPAPQAAADTAVTPATGGTAPEAGGAQVVKTVPAPSATPEPLPSPPPEPPMATRDPVLRDGFKRALDASARGDLATAERELKAIVEKDGTLAYAWTNLGVVYERQGKNDVAESAYQKSLQLDPGQSAAWDYLTRLYCRTGRGVKIEATLRSKIGEQPAAIGLRTALVVALLNQGKFESAINEAKKVLKADERNARAMQLLAQAYFREGKNELAKMVLENARAIDPNDPITHNALGLVHLALKSRAAALESFKQASELRPDFAEARNNYGVLLNESQDYDAAARELEAAVAAAPDFVAARMNLGNAYRGQQQFDKALEQYKEVLRLAPRLADTYFNLAILHLDSELPKLDTLERYKSAISYFDQYRAKGGKDDRVDQYVKDAQKGIEKEERRRERERKEAARRAEKEAKDRKAAEEAEAKKRAEEAAAAAKPATATAEQAAGAEVKPASAEVKPAEPEAKPADKKARKPAKGKKGAGKPAG